MPARSIVITGASRGIGLAIARLFYAESWKVCICARGETSLLAAKSEMPGLITFQCDLGERKQVGDFAKFILEKFGLPDVLVNNAGIFKPGEVGMEEEGVLEEQFAVNIASAYHLTRALLPKLLDRNSGTILNVCSTASLKAYPNGGSYSITKHALHGFSRNLREELKSTGIRVSSLFPGATFTDSWAEAGIPEDRMMPPEDIARLVHTIVHLSPRTTVEEILVRPQKGDL